jgi:hypothetical protein
MPRYRVEYDSRIDGETIQCRVFFYPDEPRHEIRIFIPVKATVDEVPEPQKPTVLSNALQYHEGPHLGPDIKYRALLAAQRFAQAFAVQSVDLPSGA